MYLHQAPFVLLSRRMLTRLGVHPILNGTVQTHGTWRQFVRCRLHTNMRADYKAPGPPMMRHRRIRSCLHHSRAAQTYHRLWLPGLSLLWPRCLWCFALVFLLYVSLVLLVGKVTNTSRLLHPDCH